MSGASAAGGADTETLHGSCVAIRGRGLLVTGASGSGKSGLALDLMSRGACLVSDDRVILSRMGRKIMAAAPEPIAGLIEARGIGLLNADTCGPVPLAVVVDLDRTETARMPEARQTVLLGYKVALLLKVDSPLFAAALVQYLKSGRR